MSFRSIIKKNLGPAACALVGRKFLVRTSRYFLNEARLDSGNDMESNGELALQKQVLNIPSSGEPLFIFDVGANQGAWTLNLLKVKDPQRQVEIHCFEPSKDTLSILEENIKEANYPQCVLVNKALSDSVGQAELFIAGKGLGINSLHHNFGDEEGIASESVELTTLDNYMLDKGIDNVTIVKIDAEGHDYQVLCGAKQAIENRQIDFIQFEYSWRWINSRNFLKDVFTLIEPYNYQIGKITRKGIEFYDQWVPDLETFTENNYLVCKRELKHHLQQIKWWKD